MRSNGQQGFLASAARHARLALKELRETLRDRRTLATLVFMPILVYPLLSMAFQRFLIAGVHTDDQPGYRVAVTDRQLASLIEYYLQMVPLREESGEQVPVAFIESRHPAHAVVDGAAVLGVTAERLEDGAMGVRLSYRDDFESRHFAREMETRLLRGNIYALRTLLADNGFPNRPPLDVIRHPIQRRPDGPSPLATLVPLILILMTITGAVYPAIDLTAGERERGTLETLIAAPVSRLSLLLAKYVAVVTVALLTATMNLVAMTVTIQLTGLGSLLFEKGGLSILTILSVFVLLILFAAFFSAILLSITAFARSFKEAQAYLIPLMLVSIAPGLLSMTPGVELSVGLAAVPLVNMVLVARDIFLGTIDVRLAVVAVLTTILYAAAALGFAARIFGADAILYGSHRSWSDLWERPAQARAALPLSAAITCVALLFPGQFLLGGLIAQAAWLPLASRLMAAGAATLLLFLVVPLISAWLHRVIVRSGFGLRVPGVLAWPAAVSIGASLWPIAHWAFQLGGDFGLLHLSDKQLEAVNELLRQLRAIPLPIVVISLGVLPGICEEWFFRGALFQAMRRTMSPWASIGLCALLFALFHLVTPGMLATERFLPSLTLGLILGWIAHRTGSVIPAMVVHAVHNGFLLSLLHRYDFAAAPSVRELLEAKIPTTWLIASLAALAVGWALLMVPLLFRTSRATNPKPSNI